MSAGSFFAGTAGFGASDAAEDVGDLLPALAVDFAPGESVRRFEDIVTVGG